MNLTSACSPIAVLLRLSQAADARPHELHRSTKRTCIPVKKKDQLALLAVASMASHHTFADGGIGAAAGFGNLILITTIGWMCISIYLGLVLKKLSGRKSYIFASPLIPWISILVMIVVAGLFGVMIDSLIAINSSVAESIGLYAALAFHLLVCALVYWKVRQRMAKNITLYALVPTVLASYLWVDVFVI